MKPLEIRPAFLKETFLEDTTIIIKTISIQDHWLNRAEYEQLFPRKGTNNFSLSIAQIDTFLQSLITGSPIFTFDQQNESVEPITADEITYHPSREGNFIYIQKLNIGLKLSYDFCLDLYLKTPEVPLKILEKINNASLKIIHSAKEA